MTIESTLFKLNNLQELTYFGKSITMLMTLETGSIFS